MHSHDATAFDVVSVGTISTPFETAADAPRQGFLSDAIGTIEVYDPYDAGIRGLETGDTVDVIWFADRADRSITTVNRGETGVFALRSQDRPNPIGITRCLIADVGDARLDIRGVDMRDGTPLLDLKPSIETDGNSK